MCKVVNIIILFDGCERFSLVIMQLLPTSHGKASQNSSVFVYDTSYIAEI